MIVQDGLYQSGLCNEDVNQTCQQKIITLWKQKYPMLIV